MSSEPVVVKRPDRWDHPLDAEMSLESVRWLLKQAPFASMDSGRFASNTPLADVLRNDSRLLTLAPGDVVFREGQYGGSAYLVLDGTVRIFLSRLFASRRHQGPRWKQHGWLSAITAWARPKRGATDRRKRSRTSHSQLVGTSDTNVGLGHRGEGTETRIFLQDIPGILSTHATSKVGAGELFGEMAAVTRTPREFTAAAETEALVLEIRWQGLKLLKQDPAFRRLLDERYCSEVLQSHLRETPLFRFMPEESLQQVVAATKLEQFGELEWYAQYKKQSQQSASSRIAKEPLIAEEGSYATGLWIIRSGFARLSRRQGVGHRTLAYLNKGQMYGLRELVHNCQHGGATIPLPYQESLRAIGYVDALCIPKQTVIEHVLPFIRSEDLPTPITTPRYQFGQPVVDAALDAGTQNIETGLLEFLVDQRLMNGRQAMLIDTDRCTRCDDCVRACATTHGGTPVFTRQGPQYGRWMFAQACMHCEDPVCMIGCPTGAIHRDHESGLVHINEQNCIGCKSCAESCPYDNIRMVISSDEQGRARIDQTAGLPILQASKCDLCTGYAGGPSCQAACPHDALVRIDVGNLTQLNAHITRRAG
ncbi:MAG: cyclic nucleotide-binding domain-containing protein [Pirellulaceae bacterium]